MKSFWFWLSNMLYSICSNFSSKSLFCVYLSSLNNFLSSSNWLFILLIYSFWSTSIFSIWVLNSSLSWSNFLIAFPKSISSLVHSDCNSSNCCFSCSNWVYFSMTSTCNNCTYCSYSLLSTLTSSICFFICSIFSLFILSTSIFSY